MESTPTPRAQHRAASGPRRASRRAILVGAAGAAFLGGCGRQPAADPTPVVFATPGIAVAAFEDPARWRGRHVTVAAWGGEVQDALRAAVWEPFSRATGADVVDVVGDYALLGTPQAGRAPYADLVLVDAVWAAGGAAAATLQPLPDGLAAVVPPLPFGASPLTVPAFAYALVGAHVAGLAGTPPPLEGWAAWWDVAAHPGARALGSDPLGTLEFALLADGVAFDQLYPLDLDRAVASLRRVRDSVGDRWWTAGFDPVGWLGSGRAALASAWHHRVVAGNWDGLGLTIVWRQGMLVADRWGVPAAAENADVAADLVRYALTPEVQAALASVLPLGPVVPEAFGLIDPFVAATLPTDPSRVDQLFVPDAAWWAANRAEARRRIAEVAPLAAPVSG